MDLTRYRFPVEETSVFYTSEKSNDASKSLTAKYKAIVRSDNKALISIMPKTYTLVPNDVLISELMEKLEKTDQKYYVDPSHSFVDNKRMRLQLTFPELTLNDDESKTHLSLFIHNSYDGSEGVRGFWGAIRGICSNGMIFGTVLNKFYHRHTSGIDLANIKMELEKAQNAIPQIQERFDALQRLELMKWNEKPELSLKEWSKTIEKEMGTKIFRNEDVQNELTKQVTNAYAIMQALTWVISHNIDVHRRAFYQNKLAKVMGI